MQFSDVRSSKNLMFGIEVPRNSYTALVFAHIVVSSNKEAITLVAIRVNKIMSDKMRCFVHLIKIFRFHSFCNAMR